MAESARTEPRRAAPWPRRLFAVGRDTAAEFKRDNGSLLAAALSFYGILSVFPLLLLTVSAAGFFLGQEAALAQVAAQLEAYLGAQAAPLVATLEEVVEARGVVGGVGLLGLLWAGLGGIATLERAINRTRHFPPRGLFRQRLFALGMLVLIGLLIVASIGITSLIAAAEALPGLAWLALPAVTNALGVLIPALVSISIFTLVYRFFPNGPSAWLPALVAGVTTGFLWELAKQGYVWYVRNIADFGAVYGPLGGLVGLILWIYYTSILVVIGAEFSWVLQKRLDAPERGTQGGEAEEGESGSAPAPD